MTNVDLERQADAVVAGEPIDGATVLEGQPPPLFDGLGASAMVLLLLAATAWAIVVMRGVTFDPWMLLTALVAAGASARAVMIVSKLKPRLDLGLIARRHRLVVLPEGLVWRSPDGTIVLPRASIAAIHEEGDWKQRSGGRRFGYVWIIAEPQQGQAIWSLPPIFDETPGVLAARLSRWLGPVEPSTLAPDDDELLPSARYAAAASGVAAPGVCWIRHGMGWLRRGPYAGPLFALMLVPIFASNLGLHPLLIVLLPVVVAVPLGWILVNLRDVSPRKGISMVLTPTELLLRTRGGILRTDWRDVQQIHVDSTPGWTLLEGFARARRLVISRREDAPIRYDEAYLGLPAEAVQQLLNAYRKRLLPRPRSEA